MINGRNLAVVDADERGRVEGKGRGGLDQFAGFVFGVMRTGVVDTSVMNVFVAVMSFMKLGFVYMDGFRFMQFYRFRFMQFHWLRFFNLDSMFFTFNLNYN